MMQKKNRTDKNNKFGERRDEIFFDQDNISNAKTGQQDYYK